MQILSEVQRPISVPRIRELLAHKKITPNKTTLYRMLEKLSQSGQVEALLLDPKVTYYELKKHHHHHFRCQSCDSIECVTDPELETHIHTLEKKLEAKGLKVKDHHFSLSGRCSTCS